MNWKLWGKGLLSAVINAAIGAVLPVAVNWGQTAATGVSPDPVSGGTVGLIAAGAAILGASNYLVKSPRSDPSVVPEAETKP